MTHERDSSSWLSQDNGTWPWGSAFVRVCLCVRLCMCVCVYRLVLNCELLSHFLKKIYLNLFLNIFIYFYWDLNSSYFFVWRRFKPHGHFICFEILFCFSKTDQTDLGDIWLASEGMASRDAVNSCVMLLLLTGAWKWELNLRVLYPTYFEFFPLFQQAPVVNSFGIMGFVYFIV